MKPFLVILFALLLHQPKAQNLRNQLMKQYSLIKNVRLFQLKSTKNMFVAISAFNKGWDEELKIIGVEKQKLSWVAALDTPISGGAIISAKQVSIYGFSQPPVEVYNESHQGNGFYYLYAIKGKSANCVANTRAVNNNYDGNYRIGNNFCDRVFKNGKLSVQYQDVNNDGFTDIILTGTIIICLDDTKIIKQLPARKVLVYDKHTGRFMEDLKQRQGFKKDDE